MKRILIIMLFVLTIVSCNKSDLIKDYAIVKDVTTEQQYDPVIHQYKDIYKIVVTVSDTTFSMVSDYKPEIGDTLIIYKYIHVPHKQ